MLLLGWWMLLSGKGSHLLPCPKEAGVVLITYLGAKVGKSHKILGPLYVIFTSGLKQGR